MDHNQSQRAAPCTEDRRVILTEVSNCNQCLRVFLPICLMTACFGFVLLLSGVISIITFKAGEGRVILAVVGFFVASFGAIFYILIKIKLDRGKKRPLDLQTTEAVYVVASQRSSVVVKNEAAPPCHGERQLEPGRQSLHRSEVPANSTTPMLPCSVKQSSAFDNEELSPLEVVDLPPTYEEATACTYYK